MKGRIHLQHAGIAVLGLSTIKKATNLRALGQCNGYSRMLRIIKCTTTDYSPVTSSVFGDKVKITQCSEVKNNTRSFSFVRRCFNRLQTDIKVPIGGFHAISGDTNNNGEMNKCWWTNKTS